MIGIEVLDAVDSTSDLLKRRIEAGFAGEASVLARVQTGGRGRLGREWRSPAGNMYWSVLLRPGRVRWPGHWSLLVAVAVAEAVSVHADPAAVRLKWPNDVLLGGGKLAGILLEAGDDGAPWLVVGIGINLLVAPEGLGRAIAALGAGAASPEALAAAVLERLLAWRGCYEREGFGPVAQAWLTRGHAIGDPITVASGSGRVAGRFAGLSPEGALRMTTETGTLTISSGEIADRTCGAARSVLE